MKIALLLLMAGQSKRLQSSTPKQFLPLNGEPLYKTTLNQFRHAYPFSQIILVTQHPVDEPGVHIAKGGATRQESTKNGLAACNDDIKYVMVHDAARPFVTKEIILSHIEALPTYHAVNTAIPATDTMLISESGKQIDSIPDRSLYYNGQTPQSFTKELLTRAHQTTLTDQTDDCTLVLKLNHPIHIVPGSRSNFKVTTRFDYEMAQKLASQSELNPTLSLKDKRFIITGANSKIAQAIITQLKEKGAVPIALTEKLQSAEQIKQLFEKQPQVDGLINCMGSLLIKPIQNLTPEEINRELHNNFTAPLYACKEVKLNPYSHILNISSSAGNYGRPNYALYSASKAALTNLTQALALEQPDHYINTLAPSRTDTPMRTRNFPNEDRKELLTPEEVATQAIAILSTPRSGCTYQSF